MPESRNAPDELDSELTVRLPSLADRALAQDEEFCDLEIDGERRRIRFHDYADIYGVPGLYEHLFYELLECCSPRTVADLLTDQVRATGADPAKLRVLDLGAGNGMVAEALVERGVGEVVGVDIVPEAGLAVERDRPGLYAEYYVCDLLEPPRRIRRALEDTRFDALSSVAALGFGDVPPAVFRQAFDLVDDGGWIAFTIKEDFLSDSDGSGFSRLVRDMVDAGELELSAQRRYRHRLSVTGEPLHYVATVGRKRERVRAQESSR